MTSFPTFEEFYAAVHDGRAPFPWQARLAEQVANSGWPEQIGVPTGLGKTACIDVAVWALASQGDRVPGERALPTRVWYVVNRRILVDAAYEHGEHLAGLLHEPDRAGAEASAVLGGVAERLREIRGFGADDDQPLAVTRLRGGAELGARPPHPAQPSLLFATVPMFASTWLFRGYASSLGMRPVDAAHAGIDSLVLLDEAHLARPLRDLQEPVALCDVGDPAMVVASQRARPVLVALTATGDAMEDFNLAQEDEVHPVVRQRLNATKPVRLVEVPKRAKDLTNQLVAELTDELAASDGPVAAVLFANTAAGARATFNRLKEHQGKSNSPTAGARLLLLTGRVRRREADALRAELLHNRRGASASRDRAAEREANLVVVATQTLEVGADLDFDVLVTESCGARALVQRLGRLNRIGLSPSARGVIVHASRESNWPVYGVEPDAVWQRLSSAAGDDRVVDMAPSNAAVVVGPPNDQPNRVGELLPAHLWEWAKTTIPPPGEAPVELFYEGFDTEGPRVTICWRATRFNDGERLLPAVAVDESVDVPLYEAREVLGARRDTIQRLSKDRVTVETTSPAGLAAGDIVVLHVGDGLYDTNGWNPDGTHEVTDVSLERWPGLPLDIETLRHWTEPTEALDEVERLVKELVEVDDDFDDVVGSVVGMIDALEPRLVLGDEHRADWQAVVKGVRKVVDWSGNVPVLARRRERRPRQSILVAADAFDDLSADCELADASQATLIHHLASVGAIARKLAEAIGLPDHLAAALEIAGQLHDVGKADPRFQRWLDPRGEAADVLAKSRLSRLRWRADRDASGWPRGGRHEELSGRMVRAWLAQAPEHDWDDELVVHLVVSHHGNGRPLVPPVDDPAPTAALWEIGQIPVAVSGDLGKCDWDQPARFRHCCERYGYWGLALMEAILRQADHMASGRVEVA